MSPTPSWLKRLLRGESSPSFKIVPGDDDETEPVPGASHRSAELPLSVHQPIIELRSTPAETAARSAARPAVVHGLHDPDGTISRVHPAEAKEQLDTDSHPDRVRFTSTAAEATMRPSLAAQAPPIPLGVHERASGGLPPHRSHSRQPRRESTAGSEARGEGAIRVDPLTPIRHAGAPVWPPKEVLHQGKPHVDVPADPYEKRSSVPMGGRSGAVPVSTSTASASTASSGGAWLPPKTPIKAGESLSDVRERSRHALAAAGRSGSQASRPSGAYVDKERTLEGQEAGLHKHELASQPGSGETSHAAPPTINEVPARGLTRDWALLSRFDAAAASARARRSRGEHDAS